VAGSLKPAYFSISVGSTSRRRDRRARGRQRSTSPFHDFRLSRSVTWLEPTLPVGEMEYEVVASNGNEIRLNCDCYALLVNELPTLSQAAG